MSSLDRSSQIVEDIKWFLFETGDRPIENEFGFQHGLTFKKWLGDGHSFVVTDGDNDYTVTVSKRN